MHGSEHCRSIRSERRPSIFPLSENLGIRGHEGREALHALAAPLRSAGLLPAAVPGMDPEYLAEGFEGNDPGALVAYINDRPIAYMLYALSRRDFRLTFGPTSFGSLPYRQLRLFGYVTHDDRGASILDLFFKSLLENRKWQVAQFFDLPIDDPLVEYVTRTFSDAGRGYCLIGKVFETTQVKIEKNFETYLMSHFTKKTRYNLKREVRLLEEAAPGRVVTRVYHSPDQAADFLRAVEEIARRTHQWKTGFAPLRSTPVLIRKVSYLAERGRLRGYILFIRDVPAAFCYGMIRSGELCCHAVGYDPRFAKLNPGKVLLYKIFEDLHACHAVERLNFGSGPAEYKRVLATSSRRAFDASLYRYHPYPQLLRLLARMTDGGYQRLRAMMGPLVPYVKRRFRAGGSIGAALDNRCPKEPGSRDSEAKVSFLR